MTSTADEVADELYARDPGGFVAARDAEAARLRGAGDREAASEVKRLRRPTVAAWAVNQLVRRDRHRVEDLVEATREVDEAQRRALAGGDVDLRGPAERRQRLLDEVVRSAVEILEEAGRSSAAHEDDITRTFQAVGDADAARQVLDGRLAAPLEPPSGLADLTAWYTTSGAADAAPARQRRRTLEQRVEDSEAALAVAERELARAERTTERLDAELREARRQVNKLQRARDERRRAVDEVRAELEAGS